jgi:predicted nuclease of predicted toxin-antitoxin system
MARAIRFHLDEVCDPRIAAGLRQRGVDVTTTAEAGLLGAADQAHLDYARAEGRVIVTHDADFLRMHGANAEHAGIVYCGLQTRSLGELIRLVALIWQILEPGEMRGRVEYLG